MVYPFFVVSLFLLTVDRKAEWLKSFTNTVTAEVT